MTPAPVRAPGPRDLRSWTAAQFVGMGLVWGASFLFMKVALDGTSPLQVAWARLVLGALALGAVVLVTRSPLPRVPALWGHFVVVGVVGCAIPFCLFAWAEQHVTSGIASILNATTPLMTALMVTLFRVERLGRDRVVVLAVGLVGVVVICAPWRLASAGGPSELAGQVACLGAALGYGVMFAYLRRFVTPHGVPPVTTAFLQVGMGAAALLLATPWVVQTPVRLNPGIVGSLLLLGVLGTGVAFLWNVRVLLTWGPTAASTVTYITPVVGVVLGVLVLDERLAWYEPVGAAVVMLGILAAQGRLRHLAPGQRSRPAPGRGP